MSRTNFQPKLILKSVVFLIGISLFLIVIHLPTWLVRTGITIAAHRKRKDFDGRISDIDAMFANLDDVYGVPKSNIVLTIFLDGEVSVEKLQEIISNILELKNNDGSRKFKKLKQHYWPWGGFLFYRWDRKFQIDDHVHYYDFEGGQDDNHICSKEELTEILSKLQTKSWTRGQSPWEIHVIPKFQEHSHISGVQSEKNQSVVILRVHHAIADGYSILNFARYFCPEQFSVAEPQYPQMKISLLKKMVGILTFPFRASYEISEELSTRRDDNQLHSEARKTSGERRMVFSDRIPIDDIKFIIKNSKVSFHSIINAAVTGALRRYLESIEENPKMPEFMHAILPMPFPGHSFVTTNHFTYDLTRLPIREEKMMDRIKISDYHHQAFLKSTIPIWHFYLLKSLGGYFTGMSGYLGDRISSTTALITNFQGPSNQSRITDDHVPISDVLFAVDSINTHTGLSFSVLSYNKNIRLVVLADKEIVPNVEDVEKLPKYVEEEVKLMKIECCK